MQSTYTKSSNTVAIVLSYNNSYDTSRLITCLEVAGIDVFLLDNASEKLHLENVTKVVEKSTANIFFQTEPTNHGFGGGVNFGLRFAADYKYEYAVLLNNDVYFDDATLFTDCVALCSKDPKIGCIGIEHKREDGSTESLGGGVVHSLLGWGRLARRSTLFLEKETGYIMGSFFFLPVDVLKRVGLFDERYFIYFEEADYCRRIKLAGYSLATVADKYVYHVGSATYGGKTQGFYERYSTSSSKYVAKWYGTLFAVMAFIASAFASTVYATRRRHLVTIVKSHIEGLK